MPSAPHFLLAWAYATASVPRMCETGGQACLDQGGTIHELTADQRQAWADALPKIAQDWAQATVADGLPGTQVLEACMELMRDADQPIARHWDRNQATNQKVGPCHYWTHKTSGH